MKEVSLTHGFVARVDDEDFHWVMQFQWHTHFPQRGRTLYARRNIWRVDGSHTTQGMHRFLLNAASGTQIDHRDGNGLNNTRSNLRLATQSQNKANSAPYKNCLSGFKGVTWHRRQRKWMAGTRVNGRTIYLGYFDVAEDAARAYDAAVRRIFGAFAAPNFPEEVANASG